MERTVSNRRAVAGVGAVVAALWLLALAAGPAWGAPTTTSVSGSLIAPGVLAGEVSFSFDAADAGSGLASATLALDGSAVETVPIGTCLASGGPCPPAGGGTLWLDTRTLPDGTHAVAITIADAGGSSSLAWQGMIRTNNAPQGGAPQIFGQAQAGQTLLAGAGAWSPTPTGYAYQWLRCGAAGGGCASIPGASGSSYVVGAADAYHQLEVIVTAADANGSTGATSPSSGVVLDANGYASPPPGPALPNGSAPTISGPAREGATLTAATGAWTNGPLSYAYQWQRCDAAGLGCAPIAAASAPSYTLVAADAYARVRVLVRATGPGGTSDATSDATRVIANARGATAPGGNGRTSAAAGGGRRACTGATLRVAVAGAPTTTVPIGRTVVLRGSLRCAEGPIAGAALSLAIAPAAGRWRGRRALVQTAPDGRFAYVVGAGPSRRIVVSYRASAGQAAPTASASATVLVAPSIALAITPTRTRNGHTITFTGALAGGYEPRGGVPLELEYREGSRWMVYDTVWARPGDGRFSYRYTFERTTQPITYTFRVAVPPDGVSGYPYQAVASPARSVHVDP